MKKRNSPKEKIPQKSHRELEQLVRTVGAVAARERFDQLQRVTRKVVYSDLSGDAAGTESASYSVQLLQDRVGSDSVIGSKVREGPLKDAERRAEERQLRSAEILAWYQEKKRKNPKHSDTEIIRRANGKVRLRDGEEVKISLRTLERLKGARAR